jgi:hypothetical protein
MPQSTFEATLSGILGLLHQRGHRLRREQGVAHATAPLRGLHPDFLCYEFQAKSALHIVGAQHAAPLQKNSHFIH